MHFFFDVSIPKSTTAANPHREALLLSFGEIRRVEITIPIGHKGKAHLQLLDHEFQIYPLSRGEDYHGDGCQVSFSDQYLLEGGQYGLAAVGWNTDTASDHSFLVGVDVEEPDAMTINASAKTLASLKTLVGEQIEV
jgi:hypothetical protein